MVTVADVARRAKVSVSTAARALSGNGYASADARRRVNAAAVELGYVANHVARSLRTQRTKMIGLLIGDVENTFYSVIAKNVEAVANEAGYHVVLCNSNDDPKTEAEYLSLLEGMRVDGVIVTPTSANRRHLERLQRKDVWLVQIDRRVPGLRADAVLVDNDVASQAAVTYLIDAGHVRIGIVTGPTDVQTASGRLSGYERALKAARIPLRTSLIRSGSFHREHAAELASGLLRTRPMPTAIFAANNVLAEGCLLAAAEARLRIPRDLSLVAFDDVEWMSLVHPPITAVRQPVAAMARTAADLMLKRLTEGAPRRPSVTVFTSELIVRRSVAANAARTGQVAAR